MILYDESAIFNVLITLRSSVRCCPCINSRWQQRVSFIYLYVWHVCGFCVFLMCQFQRFFLLTCPRKTRFKAHTHQKKYALCLFCQPSQWEAALGSPPPVNRRHGPIGAEDGREGGAGPEPCRKQSLTEQFGACVVAKTRCISSFNVAKLGQCGFGGDLMTSGEKMKEQGSWFRV